MINDINRWFEVVKLCLIGACFGLVGGIARVLNRGVKGWCDLFSQMFISAFCGILAFSLLAGQVHDIALVGLCGIAGNSGGMLLDSIRFRLIRNIICKK